MPNEMTEIELTDEQLANVSGGCGTGVSLGLGLGFGGGLRFGGFRGFRDGRFGIDIGAAGDP